ncbi:transcriptional regulator [compost metagenome]|uniref:helix-turn-helix domain-containing protein n=1 Tax=Sphingomonas sp. PL20 TaxID=2760712 RepID=UPI001AE372C5
MSKSVFSDRYRVFLRHIVDRRKQAGLTQTDLAARLVRAQSFISKSENGERRLDFVEVVEWLTALGIDPATFVRDVLRDPGFDL